MRLDVKVSRPFGAMNISSEHSEGTSEDYEIVCNQNMANVNVNSQRQLLARSERVKGIDFHPTEPWVFVINGVTF